MNRTSRNTLITLAGNLLATLLGMLVVISVSSRYGAASATDAFWIAYALPSILGQVYLSASLLVLSPAFVGKRTEAGDTAAWALGNTFLTGAMALAAGISVLLFVAAPLWTRLLAPGYDGPTADLAAGLLRGLAPAVLGLAISGVGTSLLISHHRFGVASMVRPLSLACVLGGILFFASHGIHAYAYAVTAGSLASAACVALALRPYASRLRPSWSWRHTGVAAMMGLLPVVLLARGIGHGNEVLIRAIASTLPIGSVSALGYAWAIFQVPGLLGASLATVVFPQFSEKLAARRTDELVSQTVTCVKILFLLSGALATGLVTLGVPLVQVLLERGLFRHSDTLLTGRVVACYGIGVLVTSVNGVVGNLFWSLRQVKTRVALEAGAIAAGLVAAFLLAPRLGAAGLALATSGMYLVLTWAGFFTLARWILPSPRWKDLLPAVGKTLAGCLAMGAAIGTSCVAAGLLGLHPVAVLASGGALGLAVYVLVGWRLQGQVLNLVLAVLFRRQTVQTAAVPPASGTAPLPDAGACEVGR